MLNPCFHSFRWYAPLRIIETELSPLGHAQLPGAHEYQGRKTQGAARNECTLIAVYGTQKCANLPGLGDTREVAARRHRQGSAQVGCGITLCSTGRNRISKDLAAVLVRPVRSVERAARLDATQATQQLGCGDQGNRS